MVGIPPKKRVAPSATGVLAKTMIDSMAMVAATSSKNGLLLDDDDEDPIATNFRGFFVAGEGEEGEDSEAEFFKVVIVDEVVEKKLDGRGRNIIFSLSAMCVCFFVIV
jgi:hypothetical protein